MRKLKCLRIALAVFSLAAMTACFVDFTGHATKCVGLIAKLQFWPGVLALSVTTIASVLALTFLFGRVYCSVVCPLGILQDVFIFFRRLFKFKFSRNPEAVRAHTIRTSLRFSLLALFTAGGFAGLHFQWLEPYAVYGRIASTLLSPLSAMTNNKLVDLFVTRAPYLFRAVEVVLPPLAIVIVACAFLFIIATLAVWKGRLWCNAVCPVGTILGTVASVSLMKIKLDTAKCVKCSMCAQVCKTQSIDYKNGKIDRLSCVTCFDCAAVCKKGAITWSK